MATEKRMIDANEMKNNIMEAMMRQFEKNGDQIALRIAEMMCHFIDVTDTVDAVPVDDIKLHRILIDNEGVPEVKIQIGDRYFLLRTDPVDVREVVHGRWVHPKNHVVSNEFLCSECNHGEVSHHVIHPLPGGGYKSDEHGNFFYPPKMNYCPNCGAKMDGDGNA